MKWNEILRYVRAIDYLLPILIAFIVGAFEFGRYVYKRKKGTIPKPKNPFYKSKALMVTVGILIVGFLFMIMAGEVGEVVLVSILMVFVIGVHWPGIQGVLSDSDKNREGIRMVNKLFVFIFLVFMGILALILSLHGEEFMGDIINIYRAL